MKKVLLKLTSMVLVFTLLMGILPQQIYAEAGSYSTGAEEVFEDSYSAPAPKSPKLLLSALKTCL